MVLSWASSYMYNFTNNLRNLAFEKKNIYIGYAILHGVVISKIEMLQHGNNGLYIVRSQVIHPFYLS